MQFICKSLTGQIECLLMTAVPCVLQLAINFDARKLRGMDSRDSFMRYLPPTRQNRETRRLYKEWERRRVEWEIQGVSQQEMYKMNNKIKGGEGNRDGTEGLFSLNCTRHTSRVNNTRGLPYIMACNFKLSSKFMQSDVTCQSTHR